MEPEQVELEHSPNPQVARGVYGFVMFLFFSAIIVLYFVWILIPDDVSSTWTYEPPQKYWAFAVPVFFCTTLFLFAFCIYPAMHSLHDARLDDLNSIQDSFTVPSSQPSVNIPVFEEPMDEVYWKKLHERKNEKPREIVELKLYNEDNVLMYPPREIQPAADLDLDKVCRLLYNRHSKNK